MCLPPSFQILYGLWNCQFIHFLSFPLSLSPFLCSFQFINLFYGAKVIVENWSFFNWTTVAVLASLSLLEKLPIFFPAHQTWPLSLSLFLSLKNTRKKQRDFSKMGQSTNSLNWNFGRAKHMTCYRGAILIWAPQILIDGAIHTESNNTT